MKKWKVAASGLTALTLASSLLAGCGSGGSSDNAATNSNQGNTSKTLPTGQTITLWSWAGGPQLDDIKKIADKWAKDHGDTVNVVDQSHNAKGFQFYGTSARVGKGPDVLIGMPHDNNGVFAQQGLLAEVPDGVVDKSQYAQNVLDAVSVNGKMYSVPISVQTTAIYYNKKLIQAPPTTWDDFMKDANDHGFMYDQANLYFNYALIGGFGGYVFKNNNGTLDTKDIGLANEGATQAYQLMYDMDNKYHWMTPSTDGNIAKAQFIAGKVGMYVSGPWDTADLKKANVDYGITPWPTLSNGQPATPFLGVITGFVNSKSSTQDADWSLMQALSNSDAQLTYFNDSQQIPAMTSAQQSSAVQGDPAFKAFSDAVQHATPMPNVPEMQAVWNAMSVLKNIISGKVSPQDGAKDFVNNIQKGILTQGS